MLFKEEVKSLNAIPCPVSLLFPLCEISGWLTPTYSGLLLKASIFWLSIMMLINEKYLFKASRHPSFRSVTWTFMGYGNILDLNHFLQLSYCGRTSVHIRINSPRCSDASMASIMQADVPKFPNGII